jgi:hypothetical protein
MSELKTFIPNKIFIFAFVWVFILPLVYYFFQAGESKYLEYKDKKALTLVKSIHLDEATIAGTNIPPVPDEKQNNATLLGIDSNKNYIRDDVELAIYAKYATSTQERVALLGYAQALGLRYYSFWKDTEQIINDNVFSYSYCFEQVSTVAKDSDSVYNRNLKTFQFVENLIFNTKERKKVVTNYYERGVGKYSVVTKYNKCLLDFTKIK